MVWWVVGAMNQTFGEYGELQYVGKVDGAPEFPSGGPTCPGGVRVRHLLSTLPVPFAWVVTTHCTPFLTPAPNSQLRPFLLHPPPIDILLTPSPGEPFFA